MGKDKDDQTGVKNKVPVTVQIRKVSHCEVVQAQQSVRVGQVRISDRAVIIPPSPVSYLE